MNRDDLKRPKQVDFIGYDNRSNSFFDRDGYIVALENYLSDLEECCKTSENRAEYYAEEAHELQAELAIFNYQYLYYGFDKEGLKATYFALEQAIADAMPYVVKWSEATERHNMQHLFEECIDRNKSYVKGVADFYKMLGYKNFLIKRGILDD